MREVLMSCGREEGKGERDRQTDRQRHREKKVPRVLSLLRPQCGMESSLAQSPLSDLEACPLSENDILSRRAWADDLQAFGVHRHDDHAVPLVGRGGGSPWVLTTAEQSRAEGEVRDRGGRGGVSEERRELSHTQGLLPHWFATIEHELIWEKRRRGGTDLLSAHSGLHVGGIWAGNPRLGHGKAAPNVSMQVQERSHWAFCSSVPYRVSTTMLPVSGALREGNGGERREERREGCPAVEDLSCLCFLQDSAPLLSYQYPNWFE
jgi:hypothetical protein